MENLIKILNNSTSLKEDVDLFAYEIPLDKSGLWVSDAQIDSRFNDSGAEEFDCYYRGKNKKNAMKNIKYLKSAIDAMSGSNGLCSVEDIDFNLKMLYTWDYMEKDSEGYFVWASRLRLITS